MKDHGGHVQELREGMLMREEVSEEICSFRARMLDLMANMEAKSVPYKNLSSCLLGM